MTAVAEEKYHTDVTVPEVDYIRERVEYQTKPPLALSGDYFEDGRELYGDLIEEPEEGFASDMVGMHRPLRD